MVRLNCTLLKLWGCFVAERDSILGNSVRLHCKAFAVSWNSNWNGRYLTTYFNICSWFTFYTCCALWYRSHTYFVPTLHAHSSSQLCVLQSSDNLELAILLFCQGLIFCCALISCCALAQTFWYFFWYSAPPLSILKRSVPYSVISFAL